MSHTAQTEKVDQEAHSNLKNEQYYSIKANSTFSCYVNCVKNPSCSYAKYTKNTCILCSEKYPEDSQEYFENEASCYNCERVRIKGKESIKLYFNDKQFFSSTSGEIKF